MITVLSQKLNLLNILSSCIGEKYAEYFLDLLKCNNIEDVPTFVLTFSRNVDTGDSDKGTEEASCKENILHKHWFNSKTDKPNKKEKIKDKNNSYPKE